MKRLLPLFLLAATAISAAPSPQTFLGVITDDECPTGDHSQMKMGPTDAECARACILFHGASYVLSDGKTFYYLSDQKEPAKLAGQKVKVVGTLDAKTRMIHVESITASKSK